MIHVERSLSTHWSRTVLWQSREQRGCDSLLTGESVDPSASKRPAFPENVRAAWTKRPLSTRSRSAAVWSRNLGRFLRGYFS